MLSLERALNGVENGLTYAASIPIAGTAPGLLKCLLGSSQAACATTAALASHIPQLGLDRIAVTAHAWVHVQHGVGNIAAGAIEAKTIIESYICIGEFIEFDP